MTKWLIEYFTSASGRIPVRDFIDTMPAKTRAKTFRTLELIEEYGPGVGEPHVKYLDDDLWEVRIRASEGTYRILFTEKTGRILLLLHGFQKKSFKTPTRMIETARKRMRESK